MPEVNPYQHWLKIDSARPDYFELLGVEFGCRDVQKIKKSAEIRRMQVRSNKPSSANLQPWKDLQNEIKLAAKTLCDPVGRQVYIESIGAPEPGRPRQRRAAPAASPIVASGAIPVAKPVDMPSVGAGGSSVAIPAAKPVRVPAPASAMQAQPVTASPSPAASMNRIEVVTAPRRRKSTFLLPALLVGLALAGVVGAAGYFVVNGSFSIAEEETENSEDPGNSNEIPSHRSTSSSVDGPAPSSSQDGPRHSSPSTSPAGNRQNSDDGPRDAPGFEDAPSQPTQPDETQHPRPDTQPEAVPDTPPATTRDDESPVTNPSAPGDPPEMTPVETGPPAENEPDQPTETEPEIAFDASEISEEFGFHVHRCMRCLHDRRFEKATAIFKYLEGAADTPSERLIVSQLKSVSLQISDFWRAVVAQAEETPGGTEIQLQGDYPLINVVEANSERVVIRVLGDNREYPTYQLPDLIAEFWATEKLGTDSAQTSLAVGTFRALDYFSSQKRLAAAVSNFREAATSAPDSDQSAQAKSLEQFFNEQLTEIQPSPFEPRPDPSNIKRLIKERDAQIRKENVTIDDEFINSALLETDSEMAAVELQAAVNGLARDGNADAVLVLDWLERKDGSRDKRRVTDLTRKFSTTDASMDDFCVFCEQLLKLARNDEYRWTRREKKQAAAWLIKAAEKRDANEILVKARKFAKQSQ